MSLTYRVPRDADHVLIAANPRAGSGSGREFLETFVEAVATRGWRTEVKRNLDEVTELAQRRHAEGKLRALVAAGGDGTIAELVNRTSPEIPICPLPLGTENLLAKHVGLNRGVERVAATVTDGHCIRLDAGRAGDRIFLLMASCGMDAEVVKRLHRDRGKNITHYSYFRPLVETLRGYEYPELTIRYLPELGSHDRPEDPQAWRTITARWAFVCNLPCYGLGLQPVPRADATDGVLDVCALQRGSFWTTLRYLVQMKFGWHTTQEDCRIEQMRRIRIESEQPVAYQLDGDPGGQLPLEIEVVPQRFTLVAPREWVQQQETECCQGVKDQA